MFGFKKSRRQKFCQIPLPQSSLSVLKTDVPLYNRLPPADQIELGGHIQIFLAEKLFEGCRGLEITDEIKLTIAAQACILLLHRQTDYYPGLTSILVHPQAYHATNRRHIGDGVIIEGDEVRLGESWHRGSVVLSWEDVKRQSLRHNNAQNVVLHEFAHQIDLSGGQGDSSPVLQQAESFAEWAAALQENYEQLCADIMADRPTVLDDYGATNPTEFFAVATECFFENPHQLQQYHPQLYNELKAFYLQDPATWLKI
ncbi:MAG TPA: M90 family metallopeptidase [Methylococcales bacterium]